MKLASALTLIAISTFALLPARAQVAVYGQFTATNPSGGQGGYLYGGTTGVLLPVLSVHHAQIEGDLQGRFVAHNGASQDGLTVGPRFSFPLAALGGISPFAEALIGFARSNDKVNPVTTDEMLQGIVGVNKRVSNRVDIMASYSYAQYGANFGELTPKSFSLGISVHLAKLGSDRGRRR